MLFTYILYIRIYIYNIYIYIYMSLLFGGLRNDGNPPVFPMFFLGGHTRNHPLKVAFLQAAKIPKIDVEKRTATMRYP